MSAAGGTALVLRSAGAWPELDRALEGSGWSAVYVAPTRIVPPRDAAPLRDAASRTFDWIVLTSAHGASAFARALAQAGRAPAASGRRVACVGPSTGRVAESLGFPEPFRASGGTGSALARGIAAEARRGEKALIVRPETGSAFPVEDLERAGLIVFEAPAYRTEPSRQARQVARREFAAVVFTSPSGLRAVLAEGKAARASLARALRVAIGSTTAAALQAEGLGATVVAREPTAAAVADALRSL